MIQIKDITKKYDDIVLNGVSYRFEKNKIYVIKGVSGCGKSTLLNILGGMDDAYEGECISEGKVGYIFQNSLLLSGLTIMENLLFINDNKELIEGYARQLNVEHLLNKYPEQLSGGERQRMSVIRAMILNPSIILADEPTASLDKKNSLEIAKLFKMLKSEERVVIIATHENCFDDVADEIIYLDYGEISEVLVREHNEETEQGALRIGEDKQNNSLRVLLPLIFKRQRKKYRITSIIPLFVVIFTVLVSFSVRQNFYNESVKYYMNQYPMEVIPIMANSYDMVLSHRYHNNEKFDLYTIEEKGYVCYPLLSEEDSVLAYGGLVKYGSFPSRDNEILVSHKMAVHLHDDSDIAGCIGEKLVIKDKEYTVTGIVADISNDYTIDKEIYYGDIYYTDIADARIVYMPYESICKYGELQQTDYYMVKVNGLYEDDDLYNFVKEAMMGGTMSKWDEKLTHMKDMSDYVNKIISVTFLLAAFMAVLFIKNEIEVDLFYRRKELGYLQLFGVKKKTMWVQLVLERMVKNIVCLIVSVVTFHIIAVVIKGILDINVFVPFMYIFLLILIVIGFSFISVILPIRKFMKKSVITLITE